MAEPDEIADTVDADESAYLSPPVLRAVRLLRHIGEGDKVTNMARTARALGINRTTLLRLLRTLESERFIESLGEGAGFRIGIGFIGTAAAAFFSDDLIQLAIPVATRLSEELGLASHLGVLDGMEVIYVVRRAPNHALVSNVHLGSRVPAHAGVMGRAILAHMPVDQVTKLFDGVRLAFATEHTPTTIELLLAQLKTDRQEGLAWSDGYFEVAVGAVAAPIFGANGLPVGALNVSGARASFAHPAQRERIGRLLRAGALEISQRLGWGGNGRGQPASAK